MHKQAASAKRRMCIENDVDVVHVFTTQIVRSFSGYAANAGDDGKMEVW